LPDGKAKPAVMTAERGTAIDILSAIRRIPVRNDGDDDGAPLKRGAAPGATALWLASAAGAP
jgi:hypothetical protein